MDSATTVQVCLALGMLVLLIGALWPKLACRTSLADPNFEGRPRQSGMPVRRVRFYRIERRHELRVRDSYDRMMGRWRHPEGAPDEPASNDQRAA